MNLPLELETVVRKIDSELQECEQQNRSLDEQTQFITAFIDHFNGLSKHWAAKRMPVRFPLYIMKPMNAPQQWSAYFLEPFKQGNMNGYYQAIAQYADERRETVSRWDELLKKVPYVELLKSIRQNLLAFWTLDMFPKQEKQ